MRSLEQLQALDKLDLDKSLEDVFRIAGLEKINPPRYNVHGKVEWVLKWLVQNLKADDKNTPISLAFKPRTWALLSALLPVVPPAHLSRTLQGIEIARIGSAALNWATTIPSDAPHANGVIRNGLKRKRDEKPVALISVADELIENVLAFFNKVLALSSGKVGNMDEIERFQLQSLLRVPGDVAADLLSSSLKAISFIVSRGLSPSSAEAVFMLWQKRQVTKGDLASTKLFASQILVPIVLLYGNLDSHRATETGSESSHVRNIDAEVEQLFHDHLFGPLRNTFITQSRSQNSPTDFHEPLTEAFKAVEEHVKGIHEPRELLQIHGAISRVFELAINRSGISNPKSRDVDNAWLEILLRVLVECVGNLPTGAGANTFGSDQSPISLIETLLTIAKQKGLSPSSETLGWILLEYSGLFRPSDNRNAGNQVVHIPLVIKVLDSDGAILVDQFSTADGNTYDVKTPLLAYVTQFKRDTATGDESDSMVQLTTKLLDAYASLRKLPEFIAEWFERLESQADMISGPDQGPFLWVSQILIDRVSQHCRDGVSLDLNALIRQYSFSLSKEQTNHHGFAESTGISPNLVILEALIGGSKQSPQYLELFKELSAWIRQLLPLCSQSKVMSRLWRIQALMDSQTFYNEVLEGSPTSGLQLLSSSPFEIREDGFDIKSLVQADTETSVMMERYNLAVIDFAILASKGLAANIDIEKIREYYSTCLLFHKNDGLLIFQAPLAAIINAVQLAVRYPVILT
jgi:hypothetical protein